MIWLLLILALFAPDYAIVALVIYILIATDLAIWAIGLFVVGVILYLIYSMIASMARFVTGVWK